MFLLFTIYILLLSGQKNLLSSVKEYLVRNNFKGEERFVAVIDAGSTGTRLNIYGFFTPGNIMTYYSIDTISPGLGLAKNAKSIFKYISRLKNMGNKRMNKKGLSIKDVPIIFEATAGLRKLDKKERDFIVYSVKEAFKSLNLQYRGVSVISGVTEGLYALDSLKYLMSYNENVLYRYGCSDKKIRSILTSKSKSFCEQTRIKQSKQEYLGVIDMGGSSIQVAYEFKNSDSYNDPVHVIRTSKNKIYINFFPGWGLVDAMKIFEYNRHYKLCKSGKCTNIFDKAMEDFKMIKKPDINQVDNLLLLSFFYYKFTSIGCKSVTTIEKIRKKYTERCKGSDEKLCFELNYMIKFLESQNIDSQKRLFLAKDIAGINLNWALSRATRLV